MRRHPWLRLNRWVRVGHARHTGHERSHLVGGGSAHVSAC